MFISTLLRGAPKGFMKALQMERNYRLILQWVFNIEIFLPKIFFFLEVDKLVLIIVLDQTLFNLYHCIMMVSFLFSDEMQIIKQTMLSFVT